MQDMKRIESYRITRMKLGFRSMDLPEFRIDMEFKNMQQLDDAMASVIRNEEHIEGEHIGPVVSVTQFNKIISLIKKGFVEGAKLIVGGLGKPSGLEKGYYVKPTVFILSLIHI